MYVSGISMCVYMNVYEEEHACRAQEGESSWLPLCLSLCARLACMLIFFCVCMHVYVYRNVLEKLVVTTRWLVMLLTYNLDSFFFCVQLYACLPAYRSVRVEICKKDQYCCASMKLFM